MGALYFKDFISNYHLSYELYFTNFSFAKFKAEIDKEKVEYSKKIISVINDSIGKLVVISAASALAISQFNMANPLDIRNISIIFATLVFFIFLLILINNQIDALKFIKNDIDYFESLSKEKLKKVEQKNFNGIFAKLQNLYKAQLNKLYWIKIISLFFALLPILLLIYCLKFT